MRKITMREAIREAMDEEMARDKNVILMEKKLLNIMVHIK